MIHGSDGGCVLESKHELERTGVAMSAFPKIEAHSVRRRPRQSAGILRGARSDGGAIGAQDRDAPVREHKELRLPFAGPLDGGDHPDRIVLRKCLQYPLVHRSLDPSTLRFSQPHEKRLDV